MTVFSRIKRAFKSAYFHKIAFIILKTSSRFLLNYGPAGFASIVIKNIASKRMRWLLLLILEPVFSLLAKVVTRKLARFLPREKYETVTK